MVPFCLFIGLFLPLPFYLLHRLRPKAGFNNVSTPVILQYSSYMSVVRRSRLHAHAAVVLALTISLDVAPEGNQHLSGESQFLPGLITRLLRLMTPLRCSTVPVDGHRRRVAVLLQANGPGLVRQVQLYRVGRQVLSLSLAPSRALPPADLCARSRPLHQHSTAARRPSASCTRPARLCRLPSARSY